MFLITSWVKAPACSGLGHLTHMNTAACPANFSLRARCMGVQRALQRRVTATQKRTICHMLASEPCSYQSQGTGCITHLKSRQRFSLHSCSACTEAGTDLQTSNFPLHSLSAPLCTMSNTFMAFVDTEHLLVQCHILAET